MKGQAGKFRECMRSTGKWDFKGKNNSKKGIFWHFIRKIYQKMAVLEGRFWQTCEDFMYVFERGGEAREDFE